MRVLSSLRKKSITSVQSLGAGAIILSLAALGTVSFGFGQVVEQTRLSGGEVQKSTQDGMPFPDEQSSDQNPGSVRGTVVDQSGALVSGARVRLTEDRSLKDALSGNDGEFLFTNVAPGPFKLAVTSAGFAPKTVSGVLHGGEAENISPITLNVADTVTEVEVGLTQTEVAQEQIKIAEKQRVFGAIPNFYVSYIPDAAPLTPRQKFALAWKTVVDPFTFVFVGGAAGVEQWQNHFAGYGQGAEGYAKRFGAGYADMATGTFVGAAILPSLLKQDPRYFYRGTGRKISRFGYAVAASVICKGDNGRWQANYSNVMGSLAAGGMSNLYYPRQDRNGAGLTFENAGIGVGATAVSNVFQEFVIRKLTPKSRHNDRSKP